MKSIENILLELNDIFQVVFKNPNLVISMQTTADDIRGWDSLTHMHLINAVENHFKCEFTFNEVMNFNNVGEMALAVKNKVS